MRIIFCFAAAFGCLLKVHARTDERMIKAGDLRVHCIVSGQGVPLLFLHAGFQDLHMWDAQAAFFSKKYRVIRMDLPGHGLTEGVDTTLEVADVIRIVMDSLHIDKAGVIGLSMGAACATDFVLAYPHRVEKLVLVSPGLSGWADVMPMDSVSMGQFNKMDSIRRTGDRKAMAEYFTELWCDGPYRTPDQVDPAARAYIYRTTYNNKMQMGASPKFRARGAARWLREIQCPVLIIRGDKDVQFISRAIGWYQHELPQAKLVTFPGVAHMVNLEKPAEFNRLLNEWL